MLFHLTIGAKIKEYENLLYNLNSKENAEMIKNKVREELKNAITKENYLSEEDAKLINDFLNKIKSELKNN